MFFVKALHVFESQGGRGKSKNDTWSEEELARYVTKGSSRLNKTTPEAYG